MQSCVMLNGSVTSKIHLLDCCDKGVTIVTHPLLVMLSNLTVDGNIVSLHLPFARELATQALTDDSFMFLQTSKSNLEKSVHVWD